MEKKITEIMTDFAAEIRAIKNSLNQTQKLVNKNHSMITAIIYLLEKREIVSHDEVLRILRVLEERSKKRKRFEPFQSS